MSRYASRTRMLRAALVLALISTVGQARVQSDPNTLPTPYRTVADWAKLPDGRHFGQVIDVRIDRDGTSVWAFERCGDRYCTDSKVAPIVEFGSSGKLLCSIGAGLFVFPHGLFVDRDDNIWATDGDGKDGKGHQVFKFAPDGKILMVLGKAGVAGAGPDTFNKPTDVVVAANGDIFVADGHGNSRIVKFTAVGKFIKEWGKHGSAPGEFDTPHSLALDAAGRLFVADRGNNRIQIFDPDGKLLAVWKQFGRPSGLFIDKHDVIYVADSESSPTINPGFKRGIRTGNAKDGTLISFIPDPTVTLPEGTGPGTGTGAEGVAADDAGNVYGAETTGRILKKYVRQ
jgi:hypothetical protein